MKFKNAGFKHKWEAVKFFEEGGLIYNDQGEPLQANPIHHHPEGLQVEAELDSTWIGFCIENRTPCWFWIFDNKEKHLGIIDYFEDGVYFTSCDQRVSPWKNCEPVKPEDLYQAVN